MHSVSEVESNLDGGGTGGGGRMERAAADADWWWLVFLLDVAVLGGPLGRRLTARWSR